MKAIGYHSIFPSVAIGHTKASFEQEFATFCEIYLHQQINIFECIPGTLQGPQDVYEKMLKYIDQSEGSFLIVVPNAAHLGKDLESLCRAVIALDDRKCQVICIDEQYPDPLQNALVTLGYPGTSREKSERIRKSMQERATKGAVLGKTPFGYRIGQNGFLEICENEASIVKLIYRLYTKQNLGLRKITEYLNDRSVPTRRGGKWNMITIRDMLRNSVYMGTYNRFGLRLTGNHDHIVPPAVFRMAQDKVRERRRYAGFPKTEPYVLSGLVECGYCGNKMIGVTRRQNWITQAGKRGRRVYRYYQCQSKTNQNSCDYHTWQADKMEFQVVSQLFQAIYDGSLETASSLTQLEKQHKNQSTWNDKIRNAEKTFLRAVKRTAQGQSVIRRLAIYLEDLDRIRRLASLSKAPSNPKTIVSTWKRSSFDEQQVFLQAHLRRVVAKDRSLRISL